MLVDRTVKLSEAEQRIVCWVAATRTRSNREAGVVNGKVGPQSEEETDRIGFGAEVAFCKMNNLYPDFSVEPRRGGADCERLGSTIDVKTTRYANGKLVAVPGKRTVGTAFYALMVCDWPSYRFAGYASAAELFDSSRLADLGHGATYAMPQEELSVSQCRLDEALINGDDDERRDPPGA